METSNDTITTEAVRTDMALAYRERTDYTIHHAPEPVLGPDELPRLLRRQAE